LNEPVPQHVLITGGAGYLGSMLAASLLARGHRVTVLDRLLFGGESLLPLMGAPGFTFVRGDVTKAEDVSRAFSSTGEVRPEAVVHLAALVGFPACEQAGRAEAFRVNVGGLQTVLDVAEAMGAKRVIFASTYSIYGKAPDGKLVDESTPPNPQSIYAESKLEAERVLLEARRDLSLAAIIFRLATLFGCSGRMRFDLMVNQFVLDAYLNRELILFNSHRKRSFLHLRDALEAFRLAIEAPGGDVHGRILNLGNAECNRSKMEIAETIQRMMPDLRVVEKRLDLNEDTRDAELDSSLARKALGFNPMRSLEDGMQEILAALQAGLFADPVGARYRNGPRVMH